MFQSNNQFLAHTTPLYIKDPSAMKHVGQNESQLIPKDEGQNGAPCQQDLYTSKKFQDDLKMLGLKVKEHEDNIRNFKSRENSLDESIIDMQVSLGKYHSSLVHMIKEEDHSHAESEEETVENIMKHEKSAAGILCLLKTRHGSQASHLPLTKDVLGVVATLGKVDDDNLSRLLSEYLGMELLLAVVCKTYDGVKSLEAYEKDGSIIKSSGFHGLGTSMGRHLDGRFVVICLENLRPYVGEFVAEDPQRKLDILKPRLPSGESPPGFLGFAVNMINIDHANLFCLTANGHGLRETLFYHLFSRLQVYKTRADMLQALSCIKDGAISLDGGMVKTTGIFSLGNRQDIDVKFPKSSGMSNLPVSYFETENQIKEMNWKKERMREDMQREQALLDHAKLSFDTKKQQFVKFLAASSSNVTQVVNVTTSYNEDRAINDIVIERVAQRSRQLSTILTGSTVFLYDYYTKYLIKQPRHTSALSGNDWIVEHLAYHSKRIYDMCRVDKLVLRKLCDELMGKYGLTLSTIGAITVEESVAMFLNTLAHRMSNRQLQERYQHSGETISRHFHIVLDAMKRLAVDYIRPFTQQNEVHPIICNNHIYHPFKDCIGALDGTHIPCVPPHDKALAFHGRKSGFVQNVLAVCDFDQRFTFVSCGWEGSMQDSDVFKTVVTTPIENFPHPTGDKYYLVDTRYGNTRGYLAPYKWDRLQMQQFTCDASPTNANERFNQVHSSLHNVIKRTFGIWKNRWAILQDMPPYDYKDQVAIVGCSMALHNFISIHGGLEQETFDTLHGSNIDESFATDARYENEAGDMQNLEEGIEDDLVDGDVEMDARRDKICQLVAKNQQTC